MIGCVWAKAFTKTFIDLKVYVISPVSLKEEWRRTALDSTGLRTKDDKAGNRSSTSSSSSSSSKTKKKKKTKQKTTNVTMKELMNDHLNPKNGYDMEIFSWAKVPAVISKSVQHYVVICDEAHNMQSMDSARTKDTLSLVLSER